MNFKEINKSFSQLNKGLNQIDKEIKQHNKESKQRLNNSTLEMLRLMSEDMQSHNASVKSIQLALNGTYEFCRIVSHKRQHPTFEHKSAGAYRKYSATKHSIFWHPTL